MYWKATTTCEQTRHSKKSNNVIDTYSTATGFVFCAEGTKKTVARMPFDTLQLAYTDEATEEQKEYLDYSVGEYVPGQLHERLGHMFVLGPARDYRYEVTLRACGNPDHNEFADIGPRRTVRVCSIDEAIKVVLAYQERYLMGLGNCPKKHGEVWELSEAARAARVWALPAPKAWNRKKVGRVVYGGSFWGLKKMKEADDEMKRIIANSKQS